MIRVVNGPARGRYAISGGPPPPPVVPHRPAAVSPQMLERFARPAKDIGRRWGVTATSCLLAHLEPTLLPLAAPVLTVVERGPLAWVLSGDGQLRPGPLRSWFSLDDAWRGLSLEAGVCSLIRAAADACLAQPREAMAAFVEAMGARLYDAPETLLAFHRQAGEHLRALAVAPFVEGRSIVALAWYEGCVGPLRLEVDSASATLDTLQHEPWQQGSTR